MVDTLQEFDLAQRQQAPERQLAALAELRKTPGPGAAYLLRAARICEGTGRCCSECSVRTTCKLAGHLISTRPSCEHWVCPHAARTPCFTGRGKNASTETWCSRGQFLALLTVLPHILHLLEPSKACSALLVIVPSDLALMSGSLFEPSD